MTVVDVDDVAARGSGITGMSAADFAIRRKCFYVRPRKYSPMKSLTLRMLVALLFLGAAHPALAQTTPGLPAAISAQVEALGPVVDPVGVGKIYAQLRATCRRRRKKDAEHLVRSADLQKLDVYEPTRRSRKPGADLHPRRRVHRRSKNSYDNIGYYFARHGV